MDKDKKKERFDKSKPLDRPFLETQKGIFKKEIVKVEELKEFVLIIMKNNGHSDFIEGVQAGEFYLKTANGKEEKSIYLTPNKLTTFNYNGQYFRGWVVHEDNMSPYPQEPIHNGEMVRKIIQKVAMNYKDANDAKYLEARGKFIATMIVIGLIGIYILYIIGKKVGWFGGGNEVIVTQTIIQNVTEVVKNNTGVMVG